MSSFVLVHGGAHGAWCWEHVIPYLERASGVDAVLAVDLCGHGSRRDEKPIDEIELDDYIDNVVGDIESADLRDVVLVGHSLAGITIPHVGHRIPDRLRRLVYLTTTNPAVGETANDAMAHPLSPISRGVDLGEAFCSDLDEATSGWLLSKLGPEPPGPMARPQDQVAGPASIPSTYVLCEQDVVLPPEYQREQITTIKADEVVSIDAGHSPFASKPEELASLLLRYA